MSVASKKDGGTARKPARFGARLTPDQKALFERAAALTGRSLTDFVVDSAQEMAARTIRTHEFMTLSARDGRRLVEALLEPPAPGARLSKAAARYRKLTAG